MCLFARQPAGQVELFSLLSKSLHNLWRMAGWVPGSNNWPKQKLELYFGFSWFFFSSCSVMNRSWRNIIISFFQIVKKYNSHELEWATMSPLMWTLVVKIHFDVCLWILFLQHVPQTINAVNHSASAMSNVFKNSYISFGKNDQLIASWVLIFTISARKTTWRINEQ